MMHQHQSRDDGFTLVELLVVMIIIGILAAIAIPSFLGQRSRAYDSQARADVRAAQAEIEAFYSSALGYPDAVVWADSAAVPAGTVTVKRSKDIAAGTSSLVYRNSGDDYCISVHSRSGAWIAITSSRSGAVSQDQACTSPLG
ncbi:prepilin-type N-terminal cleavage/methylation domain-containing protein [Kineococcus sp. T13]|uniref:type IV pilin protein n=1 Tax=Kineococcus vitellinus TaxID=2696565 RepID=UPI0014136844|nr:prepilin-type N-terminal cleavage/methylation domain-containing protein [Kineococcus vitellinus]NAZ74892.1 prepilin-type N-terminal cleavage/methylation domain-containing protein [Kineococcus vitellinus]